MSFQDADFRHYLGLGWLRAALHAASAQGRPIRARANPRIIAHLHKEIYGRHCCRTATCACFFDLEPPVPLKSDRTLPRDAILVDYEVPSPEPWRVTAVRREGTVTICSTWYP